MPALKVDEVVDNDQTESLQFDLAGTCDRILSDMLSIKQMSLKVVSHLPLTKQLRLSISESQTIDQSLLPTSAWQ